MASLARFHERARLGYTSRMGRFGRWFRRGGGEDVEPAQPAPDPQAVVAALLEQIRALGVAGELRTQGNYLFIEESDGIVRHIFLGNLVQEHAKAPPGERQAVIAQYARLAVRPAGAPRSASARRDGGLRARVLPRLLPRRERELVRLRLGDAVTNLLPGRPIADGELTIVLAVDEPDVVREVVASELESEQLTEAEAYELALANLRARSTEPWPELVPGVRRSPWQSHWDGARLALPSLFRELPLRGDPIVVVPNRHVVLAAGSEHREGLAALYGLTRELAGADRPVYLAPLRLDGERWVPLGLEADRPAIRLAPSLLLMSSLQEALDHEACAPLLAGKLARLGFGSIGTLRTVELDGIAMTIASYRAGARVAIPKADMLAVERDGRPTLVAWYKVEQALAGELVPIDVWPPYFEVRRELTTDEIARLAARSA